MRGQHVLRQLQTGQADVERQHVGNLLRKQAARPVAVARGENLLAVLLQIVAQHVADLRIVVDDPHGSCFRHLP